MVLLMFVATVLPAKQVSAYEYTEPEYTEAEEQEEEEQVEYKMTTDVDFDSSKVAIVAEVKDQRTLDTKTFLKADGTYVAVLYGNVVHYLEDGKYEDIDNTLSIDFSISNSRSTAWISNKVSHIQEPIRESRTFRLISPIMGPLNTNIRISMMNWATLSKNLTTRESVRFLH